LRGVENVGPIIIKKNNNNYNEILLIPCGSFSSGRMKS
jgi:hypothetical protein